MKDVILVDRSDARKTADQQRHLWIKHVLEQTGVNLDGCFSEDKEELDQTISQKIKLRQILEINNIDVLERDGEAFIYVANELIAEWKKPLYELRQDYSQVNPKKRVYVAIHVEYWSVFDLQNVENENENV